jgi:hypothetical protein
LRRKVAGNPYIQPVVDQSSQMNDFCGHGSISAVQAEVSCSSPRVFAVAKTVIAIALTDFNIC